MLPGGVEVRGAPCERGVTTPTTLTRCPAMQIVLEVSDELKPVADELVLFLRSLDAPLKGPHRRDKPRAFAERRPGDELVKLAVCAPEELPIHPRRLARAAQMSQGEDEQSSTVFVGPADGAGNHLGRWVLTPTPAPGEAVGAQHGLDVYAPGAPGAEVGERRRVEGAQREAAAGGHMPGA